MKDKTFSCTIADPRFDKELKESDYKKLKKWEYYICVVSRYVSDPEKSETTFIKVHHKDICVANDPTLFMNSDEADGNLLEYQTQDSPQMS